MSTKLKKNTYPDNHTKDSFVCFGPDASKDGIFEGTMLCDMGCFKQGQVDSNKYYHAAVVQSTITNGWFAYFEYGRVGQQSPSFQFIQCNSKEEAQREYETQLHKKNDKRGMWVDRGVLGKVLQPKPGKDCYLVRPQATRSTGLPSAKTIVRSKVVTSNKTASNMDSESLRLLEDLAVGTQSYTRSSMADAALPTKEAIDEARVICSEATKFINKLSNVEDYTYDDKELIELTELLYSRIPKSKNRSKDIKTWILTPDNIATWLSDLDAYESSLDSISGNEVEHNLPFRLEWLKPGTEKHKFVHNFFLGATRNKHSYMPGQVTIRNIWEVHKEKEYESFTLLQKKIEKEFKCKESPLHQVERKDLSKDEADLYRNTGTYSLFHGTRSVNVSGILKENLRLPKTLSNVVITGAMFGSGCYWADDYKKSLGYTSYQGSYWSRGSGSVGGRGSFMFIGDVLCGNMHVATSPRAFQGPPNGYHSIFGKAGYSVQNNEYIVFDGKQNNLRYLVEFN